MNNKPLKYAFWFFLAALIIIIVARKMDNQILLFPFWLKSVLYLIALPIAYYLIKKWAIFGVQDESNKNMHVAVNGLCTILLAFVFFLLMKMPINIAIIQQSKQHEIFTETCPITFYSVGFKNKQRKHITFTFQNKDIRMKVKPSTLDKIKSLSTSQKNIQLQLRKSIFGTYCVEDYSIQ